MTEKVHIEAGDRLIIEIGGAIIVRNGGVIRAEPGAIVDIPEQVEFYSGAAFVLSARERIVLTTSNSAVAVTVPPFSAVPLPPGTQRTLIQLGTGQVSIVAGAGVTIRTSETLRLAKQHAAATLIATETPNEWILFGYLEAA